MQVPETGKSGRYGKVPAPRAICDALIKFGTAYGSWSGTKESSLPFGQTIHISAQQPQMFVKQLSIACPCNTRAFCL